MLMHSLLRTELTVQRDGLIHRADRALHVSRPVTILRTEAMGVRSKVASSIRSSDFYHVHLRISLILEAYRTRPAAPDITTLL